MMKKIHTLMMTALMAVMTISLTACDEDVLIAETLEGTWAGTMYVYTSYHDTRYYATSTEITFEGDPFRWTRGTGYWVDYYSNAPWDYVANHIEWKVNNRNIEVYFVEDRTTMVIRDYHLNDNSFTGYIADGENDVEFRLRHISSPNWNRYDRWGYDGWNGYWSRETRGISTDSTTVTSERPIRKVGMPQ
ncbi:MAG: hepatitis A virus cellular receptor 1 [Prevotella sp.]|nr:hepatitis A virus cellular receptor 1 [Prevotella sp.]